MPGMEKPLLTPKSTTSRRKLYWRLASAFVLVAAVAAGVVFALSRDKQTQPASLPPGFVRLSESDPTIIQEIRYFGSHNFVGRPIDSYNAAECILTDQAAHALSLVQLGMLSQNLSLKVYDCYRPQSAVNDFMVWALNNDTDTKKEFYPLVSKPDIFPDGYVASKSGHSRGSTVDLTIVPCCPAPPQPAYVPGITELVPCTASLADGRFPDNMLDFGTGFDCFSNMSWYNLTKGESPVNPTQQAHRMLLLKAMRSQGFVPFAKEWWHFTVANEPFPDTYFDFPVT